MKNRPAYKLTKTIRFYDWLHVFANGICSMMAFYVTRGDLTAIVTRTSIVIAGSPTGTIDCWGCKKTGDFNDPNDRLNLYLAGCYFAAKFVDLFDTVFFVLRKKDRQVTL